jgi:hypothetical protein
MDTFFYSSLGIVLSEILSVSGDNFVFLSFLRINGAMTRDEMAHLRVSLRICQERLKMMFECGRQVYF